MKVDGAYLPLEYVRGYMESLKNIEKARKESPKRINEAIILETENKMKSIIVDGKIPGYTTGQTQTYQWITDGDALKIEIIGDRAARNGLPRGTDILPRLKGKVGIITNDTNGQMVELTVYKTTK